jgi:hypothetical protein
MSNLRGVRFYGDPSLSEIITENIITFMKYGLLEIGAYYNIARGQTNFYGVNESQLRPVVMQGNTNFTIYRGVKHDWIWESGIGLRSAGGAQPVQISGIYVNNVFYATGSSITGTGYFVDYSRGQIVFSHPLPSSYVVECPQAIRYVQVYPIDGYVHRKLNNEWLNNPGATGVINSTELQAYLPAIFVGCKKIDTKSGVELGSQSKRVRAEIEFDVIASNSVDRNKILDICYNLENKAIAFYNVATAPKPLSASGTLNSTALTWPQLITSYSLSDIPQFMEDALVAKINDRILPISRGRVLIGLSLDVYPV